MYRGIIVWSWLQFITVVQYFRCQFSWDRSIIKWAQLKCFVSCVVSKKQASVLNSETIYFSSSYVIVYRGIILRTWLQLEEWYNILDANCWEGSWDYGNDTQNGGVILPRRSDLPDWGPDFRPHRYFKRKFILLEKLLILLKNVTMCQFIHAKFHAELLDIRPRHAYPALAYLHARYSRGKGGGELLNKVLNVEAPHIPQLMKFLYSRLPVTRTLDNSNSR